MGPRQTRGLVLARPAVVEPVECGQGGTRATQLSSHASQPQESHRDGFLFQLEIFL